MDPKALAHRLEGDFYDDSRRFRRLLAKEPFRRYQGNSPQEHQAEVERWCRWFAAQGLGKLGLPPSKGGDPSLFNALGYEIGFFDFNLMMRFGLQFGFLLRAVSRLGAGHQSPWLDKLAKMEKSACLAMTEAAHGSNVRGLQTTATYHKEQQIFLLHTPGPQAAKEYVTSLEQADVGLVFCRLKIGEADHGVHAFLVPLRDESGDLLPGVETEQCGLMGGLNGLSYGRLSFHNYPLQRENLLSRHAQVDEAGHYRCSLRSPSHRFNAMLGTLVVGRSLVTSGAAAGAKIALTLAIRYLHKRRQFSENAKSPERTLLSYQAMQKKLMPRLATLVALDSGRARLGQAQHQYFEEAVKDRELETFTGSLKAYTSSFAQESALVCRQVCGGAGCLAENRLTELVRDLTLFTTMEGGNTILELMTARNLLLDFQRGLDTPKIMKALGWVGKSVSKAAKTGPLKSRDTSSETLTSQEFLGSALRYKKERLLYSLARRVRSRLDEGRSLFDTLNECQEHCLLLSRAYCEEKVYRCLRNTWESCPPGWDKRVLGHLLSLFALSRIEDDKGWFLEQSYLTPGQSRAVRAQVLELCSVVAQEADQILDAFELTPHMLDSNLLDGAKEK